MDAVAERLLKKLRDVVPHTVRVYDSSDEFRSVAVPQRRRRWGQVVETIEARPWVRVELLDKGGSVLGYVENDGAATEIEDISGESKQTAQHRWFLDMMIRAQRTALEYRDKEHGSLMEGVREMMSVQTTAMRELVQLYQVQRDVAADVAAMRAAAANGGDIDQIVKLIEASPQLFQMLGPLIGMLRKPRLEAKAVPPAPAAPPQTGGKR